MLEGFSTLDLSGSDQNRTAEDKMVFFPLDTVGNKWVIPAGRLISRRDSGDVSRIKEVVLVEYGLPGDKWRVACEERARSVIAADPDRAAFFLMPGGMRGTYDLGKYLQPHHSAETPEDRQLDIINWDACHTSAPLFFNQPFSFQRYVRQLYAAWKAFSRYSPNCKVHLAGHSYGALALLYALAKASREGGKPPASANFLAPFVQVALDTQDPAIALNIINTRGDVSKQLMHGDHLGRLRDLLAELGKFYNLTQPHRNPLEWHSSTFNSRFFQGIGDPSDILSRGDCKVRIFRGSEDEYIGEGHSDLIAKRMGLVRSEIETVLPDGHGLDSLDFEELFR